jgi:hypothetical protein
MSLLYVEEILQFYVGNILTQSFDKASEFLSRRVVFTIVSYCHYLTHFV